MKRPGLLSATLRAMQPELREYRGRSRLDRTSADMVIGWGMVLVILFMLAVGFTMLWTYLPTLEPHPQVEVDG